MLYRTQCKERLKIQEVVVMQGKQSLLNRVSFPIKYSTLKCVQKIHVKIELDHCNRCSLEEPINWY